MSSYKARHRRSDLMHPVDRVMAKAGKTMDLLDPNACRLPSEYFEAHIEAAEQIKLAVNDLVGDFDSYHPRHSDKFPPMRIPAHLEPQATAC